MGQQNQGGLLDLISQGALQPRRQLTSKHHRQKEAKQEARKSKCKFSLKTRRLRMEGGVCASRLRQLRWPTERYVRRSEVKGER